MILRRNGLPIGGNPARKDEWKARDGKPCLLFHILAMCASGAVNLAI